MTHETGIVDFDSEPRTFSPSLYPDLVPFHPVTDPLFRFIDLFAGIGGFRLAMQDVGGECVFSSEWDRDAQRTYFQNFGEIPYGDIQTIDEKAIPDHDILCAGFPCQPFSLAGVSARNFLKTAHGFDCTTQGTLFFDKVSFGKVSSSRKCSRCISSANSDAFSTVASVEIKVAG